MSGNTIVLVIVFMFSIECMLLLSANRVFMLTSTLRDILKTNERFYSSVILSY